MTSNGYSDIVHQKQLEMKKHLLPSKREVLNSHPDYPQERYGENVMTKQFVENTNALFNVVNKIRCWQQNQISLPQYLSNCDDDVDEAIILVTKQFQYINLLTRKVSPNEYLMKIICESAVNGLAGRQLKIEIKQKLELSYVRMREKILQLEKEINNRIQCPVCRARIKKLRTHMKRCKPVPEKTSQMLENMSYHNRLHFEAISRITYDVKTFDELFR